MARTIIEGARILTVDAADRVLDPGWIALDGDRIEAVGAGRTAPADLDGERIDGSGRIVMPGIVNAHTHLNQVLIRGVFEGLPFLDWLRAIYAVGTVISADEGRIGAQLGALEALESGVTTVVDHHFLNRADELADAAIEGARSTGIRLAFSRAVMDAGEIVPAELQEAPAAAFRSIDGLLSRHRAAIEAGDLAIFTGPNTPGVNASDELVRETAAYARARGLRISSHVAESKAVIEAIRRDRGASGVVSYLDRLGLVGPELLAAHAVWLRPAEIRLLGRHRAAISHNPVSNMFLADGVAPIPELLRAGVVVALGTDGAASNNSQSMFEVIKAASLLQRVHRLDPGALTPTQAIRMATINGATALGRGDELGSLEAGKRADLIVLDPRRAAAGAAIHDLASHVVHALGPWSVDTVFVDGRVVLGDGRATRVDRDATVASGQRAGETLVGRYADRYGAASSWSPGPASPGVAPTPAARPG